MVRIHLRLWAAIIFLWLGGFSLIGVVLSHAQDEQQPVRACVAVEEFADAAERYDGHVRIVLLSKPADVHSMVGGYAKATGEYPSPDFAMILLFSRGDAMVALGTTQHGICWVNPVPPPYGIVAQYLMPAA